MIQNILQFGFAAVALLCLVGAWLLRTRRGYMVWALCCAAVAAGSAHYGVFWSTVVLGTMVLWALVATLPWSTPRWRVQTGLVLFLLVGGTIALYPTYHDERYGKEAFLDPNLDSEQRADEEVAAARGDRGFRRYLLANIPFRLVRGLDLKGGMRLVYSVEVEEAIRDRRDRYYDDVRSTVTRALPSITGYQGDETPTVEQMQKLAEKVTIRKVRGRADSVTVSIVDPAAAQATNKEGKQVDLFDQTIIGPFLYEMSMARNAEGTEATFRIRNEVASQIRDRAVSQARQTIQRRVDGLGLKEAAISVRDEDIIIEIPGQDEKAFLDIKDIISQTARLEFKMVDDEHDFFEESARTTKAEDLPRGLSFGIENAPIGPNKTRPIHYARIERLRGEKNEDALRRLQEWTAKLEPGDDHEIGYGRVWEFSEETEKIEEAGWRTYYLYAKADVTGDLVRDAQARPDQSQRGLGGWNVSLEFTPLGAERFEQVTAANVKRRFAIILDSKVESAPVIQERIAGGHAQITMGSGSIQQQMEDARKLELVLRSGALPAAISLTNEQMIGPSLGRDSVTQGLEGAAIGGTAVLLLMLVYYRISGLIANFAVLLNLFLQMTVLSMFSASLTLPGIAGLALTMGMAVDANVLINERIREELQSGKSARAAVATGYDKAFSAILDSHLTTLIGGLILAQYGTGPIKGFAVTLIVGITASLYTAVVVTRLFYDIWVRFDRSTRFGLRVGESA